jgi:hypothetical protein
LKRRLQRVSGAARHKSKKNNPARNRARRFTPWRSAPLNPRSKNNRMRRCILLVIARARVQYIANPPSVREREGFMDELIDRLVASTGVDRDAAEKAVGIILDFLQKEGPADKVTALIGKLPGAAAVLQKQQAADAGGGMFSMGGLMGAGTKMMAAGLSMSQVQGVTRETIAYTREKAGDDAIGEIVGAIPGLSQFI